APQPNLVPMRPRWLRRTSRSGVSASAVTLTALPLTLREVACIGFSLTENATIVDRPLTTQGDRNAFHAAAQGRPENRGRRYARRDALGRDGELYGGDGEGRCAAWRRGPSPERERHARQVFCGQADRHRRPVHPGERTARPL